MTLRAILPASAVLAALMLFAPSASFAQSPADAASSTRIQEKVRKVELLNLLLPVLLTKAQIGAFMPEIDKVKKADDELKRKEAQVMRTLEPDLDKVIKAGTDSKQVPPLETVGKIQLAFKAMAAARASMIQEQMDRVMGVLDKTLDEGQKKAAGGLILKSMVNPASPDTVTDDQRLRFWVRYVLLDPLATELLQKLALKS